MDQASLPIEYSLDRCIHCNICVSGCPVAAATDLFPGPRYSGPLAGRFRQAGQPSPDRSVDFCNGCKVCEQVCPAGVKIAGINTRARAAMAQQGGFSARRRLHDRLAAHPERVGKLARPVALLANAALGFRPARFLAEKAFGLARRAPVPRVAGQPFTAWFQRHQAARLTAAQPAANQSQVIYFYGCSTQAFEPRIGRAVVEVLEVNGFEVIVPPQNCCGKPLLSSGHFDEARRCHASNLRSLLPYARQGLPIVSASPACILTIKAEAPELLDQHDDDTLCVASQSFDLFEFLRLLLEQGCLNRNLRPVRLDLAYHAACQARAHGVGLPALEVLRLIPDLRLAESQIACCGMAGTYGYQAEKYPIAMQVGAALFDFMRRSGAPLAVCEDEACRWQIEHGAGLPAIHPVELLAAAYGFDPAGALLQTLSRQEVA